jgi:hypothetical protein
MKLFLLLDPAMPLPWNDVPLGPEDVETTDAILLGNNDAFATDLVLPLGRPGHAYRKSADAVGLRKNEIVIHTDREKTSVHFVVNELMGDLPMMVKTSDYVLRLNPLSKICPATVFAQLHTQWKGVSINRGNVEKLIAETEIEPGTLADGRVARDAVALMIKAQSLARQTESLRGEAQECLAMVGKP